jgi:hypothetical protein
VGRKEGRKEDWVVRKERMKKDQGKEERYRRRKGKGRRGVFLE